MISLKCNDREGLDLVVNLFLRTGFQVVLDDAQPDKALVRRHEVQVLIEVAPPRQTFALVGDPVCYRLSPPSITEDRGSLGRAVLAAPCPTAETPPHLTPNPSPNMERGEAIPVLVKPEARQVIPIDPLPPTPSPLRREGAQMRYAVRITHMWDKSVTLVDLGGDERAARLRLHVLIGEMQGTVVPLMTLQGKFAVTTPRGIVKVEWLEEVIK